MSEPDFRQMSDPLNDRLPPRRKGRRRPRFVEVVGDQRVLDLDPDDSRRGRLQQDPTSGGTP